MYFKLLTLLLLPLFTGCLLEDNTTQTNTSQEESTSQKTISGKVVDGYIRNAFACIDVNNNSECDGNEPYTKTDDLGAYALNIASDTDLRSARILVSGGIDNSTGKPFIAILKSPLPGDSDEEIFVTPLTTVVAARIDSTQGKSVQSLNTSDTITQAVQEVANSLGLNSDDILKDPVATQSSSLLSATLQVQKIIELLAEAEKQSNESDRTQATQRIALALAAQLDGTKRTLQSVLETALSHDTLNEQIALSNTKALAQLLASKVESIIQENSTLDLTQINIDTLSELAKLIQDDAEQLITNSQNIHQANNHIDTQALNTKYAIQNLAITSTGTGQLSILEAARTKRILELVGYTPLIHDPLIPIFRSVSGAISVAEFKELLQENRNKLTSAQYDTLLTHIDTTLETIANASSNTAVDNSHKISEFTPDTLANREFYILQNHYLISKIKFNPSGTALRLYQTNFISDISDVNDTKLDRVIPQIGELSINDFSAQFKEFDTRYFEVIKESTDDKRSTLWFYDFDTMIAFAKTYEKSEPTSPTSHKDSNFDDKKFNLITPIKGSNYDQTISFNKDHTFTASIVIDTNNTCSINQGKWAINMDNVLFLHASLHCQDETTSFNQNFLLVRHDQQNIIGLLPPPIEMQATFTYVGDIN